jgi:ankyrin repeat protein
MKTRTHLALLLVLLTLCSSGCGIFWASHHDPLQYQAIEAAAEGGDLAGVQDLIKKDPSLVNAKEWEDSNPLYLAVFHDHKEVAEFLLTHGANVNAKTTDSVTPLHIAAQRGNQEIVVLLLAHQAKINAVDSKGRTPLDRAQEYKRSAMVDFLRQQGGHE